METPWEPEPIILSEQVTVGLIELVAEVYERWHQDCVFNIHLLLRDVAQQSVWDHRTDPVFFPTARCSAFALIRNLVDGWRPLPLGNER